MKDQKVQQRKNSKVRRIAVTIGVMIMIAGFFWLLISEKTSSRPSDPLEIAAQKEFQKEMIASQKEFQQKIDKSTKEAERKSDSLIYLQNKKLNP